mmetsp:Transcript_48061/g.102686  ORF Transcript_48061/g.102686 Transcript_48061/m.102686 type:complete len:261 (-) Transcript_48061:127-909(-)
MKSEHKSCPLACTAIASAGMSTFTHPPLSHGYPAAPGSAWAPAKNPAGISSPNRAVWLLVQTQVSSKGFKCITSSRVPCSSNHPASSGIEVWRMYSTWRLLVGYMKKRPWASGSFWRYMSPWCSSGRDKANCACTWTVWLLTCKGTSKKLPNKRSNCGSVESQSPWSSVLLVLASPSPSPSPASIPDPPVSSPSSSLSAVLSSAPSPRATLSPSVPASLSSLPATTLSTSAPASLPSLPATTLSPSASTSSSTTFLRKLL